MLEAQESSRKEIESFMFQPTPSLFSLPAAPRSAGTSLSEATRLTLDARRAANVIGELDEGLATLLETTAAIVDGSSSDAASGRAKILQTFSELLERLPAPAPIRTSVAARLRAALAGASPENDQAAGPAYQPLPARSTPVTIVGPQTRAAARLAEARRNAGITMRGWAAHEELALIAAAAVDAAAETGGAASGFAQLVSVASMILSRLPTPADTGDKSLLEELILACLPAPSPFTAAPDPLYHPERDSTWQTEADEIAAFARAAGRHLQPWQYRALEVATEYRLSEAGRRVYHYSEVLITVPRQSGKTDLIGIMLLYRAFQRSHRCRFTAQTGADARLRILDLIELVTTSRLGKLFRPALSNGAEGLHVVDNSGAVTRFSPTVKALHGEHPNEVVIDEIWGLEQSLGEKIIGAAEPGQATLGGEAQIWYVSTQGTAESHMLNELCARGRAGEPQLCYIEYALPEGADPFDPASWRQFHPALGNTIEPGVLERAAMKARGNASREATFIRAYCNRLTQSGSLLIDMAQWDSAAVEEVSPPADASIMTIAYEVAPADAFASVMACWWDHEKRPVIKMLRQASGTKWLVPYLKYVQAATGATLAADGAGPAARFTARLSAEEIAVRTLSWREYASASEDFLAAAGGEGTLIHADDDTLRAQAEAASVSIFNGVRKLARVESTPTPAIIAAAVGLYAARFPTPDEEPASTIVL